LGGRSQEDHGSKPARENGLRDPISKKPFTKKGWWSGGQPGQKQSEPEMAKSKQIKEEKREISIDFRREAEPQRQTQTLTYLRHRPELSERGRALAGGGGWGVGAVEGMVVGDKGERRQAKVTEGAHQKGQGSNSAESPQPSVPSTEKVFSSV
jgi:hypothetical protein